MRKLIFYNDRIFVAGATGMAGRAICRALQKSGYGSNLHGGSLLTPTRQDLDLLDTNSVFSWYQHFKPTVAILAAAKVGGIYANASCPADFLLENLKIQSNVIEGAWRYGVRRFLFLGSSCIYPKYAPQPINEDSLLTGPLEPTNSSYALAKITGLKLCESLANQYGFDAFSLMPTNLYGPGDNYHPTNSHVLPALIRRFHEATQLNIPSVTCWGSGKPLREFLHVDDLGSATVFTLENWLPSRDKIRYLNVGSGAEISVKNLAISIANATGFNGSIMWDSSKPDGTPRKLLDVSRLKALGWESSISLTEGINKTVDSYRKKFEGLDIN